MSEERNMSDPQADVEAAGAAAAGGVEQNASNVLFPDGGAGQAGQDAQTSQAAPNATPKVEENKADGDKSDGDKPPEDGKYDLKMPDGIELDGEMAKALAPDFKELGLSNAQAQKLVDKYIEVQRTKFQSQNEQWGETVSGWVTQAKEDKEIGGDRWDDTVTAGRLAVEKFGTPALREYLNASGGGNHPEVIRFMAKVGGLLKDDNPASGGGAGAVKAPEAAHILFSNDVKQ